MQLFSMMNMVSGFGLIYATYFIPRNPHTMLAIASSIFPLTSPMVLMIRLVVSEVPTWQIILAQLLLWLTNLLAIFFLFRLLKSNLVAYKPPFILRTWLWSKLLSLPYTRLKQLWSMRRGI
jgi:ABC-2 type transport system permease protein